MKIANGVTTVMLPAVSSTAVKNGDVSAIGVTDLVFVVDMLLSGSGEKQMGVRYHAVSSE